MGQTLSGMKARTANGSNGSKKNGAYRVLIADDHFAARRGIRASLVALPGVAICGEAATGREAVELAKKEKPDLVVLDLSLPEINGVEVARTVRGARPETEVLVLTNHVSADVARVALRAGAAGYVVKSDPAEELIAAVKKVRKRKPHVTKRLARKLRREIERIKSLRSSHQDGPDATLSREQITSVLVRSEMNIRREAAVMIRKRRPGNDSVRKLVGSNT